MMISNTTGVKRKSRFGDSEQDKKRLSIDVDAAAARAAEISKELTSKIATVSSLLHNVRGILPEGGIRRANNLVLRLDDQGREIDEHGNLVKQDTSQLKTLAANLAVKKKKENPYLAHKEHKDIPQSIENEDEALVDDRLLGVKRDLRGKKSLRFVEAGKYLKEAEALRLKEERKIIAGYASGRKALQVTAPPIDGMSITPSVEDASALPPRIDTVTPSLEWWDEQFLSKDDRSRRIYDHQLLDVKHCKTYKYVQHPIPIKPLGVEKKIETIPTYLTKQERKKLRKATRREREMEKRDKMMMGLIPAPEPKFKLSNFMKILGDQAVADPSKVEMRVMQQMQQRVLNHEMRNQAAKLTPKERKDKKMAKLQEDTSKGVSVAVFRVKNFQNPKHRFKVDVNAQQLFLSGIVLLCPEEGLNMVVAEGGPIGIRKFVKLMVERIQWNELIASEADNSSGNGQNGHKLAEDDFDETLSDPEYEDSKPYDAFDSSSGVDNRCDLLWQGILPKRTFTGFKFQESKSSAAAQKMLEQKNVPHYWDMIKKADQIMESAQSSAGFLD